MPSIWIQYSDPPRLEVLTEPKLLTIIGYWDTDWGLAKKDVEKFYIERRNGSLRVYAKAHYGIQTKEKVIKGDMLTIRFVGSSHAPVGMWAGHRLKDEGYSERGFTFNFNTRIKTKLHFGKLKEGGIPVGKRI